MPTAISELTTIRVGGPAREFTVATTGDELVSLVRDADRAGTDVLVVGGGSNLVVGDDGFDGRVIRVTGSRLDIDGEIVTVDAGVEWDAVVQATIEAGLSGMEALSGIPGTTGATPIQNVGAYGASTSELLHGLTVYDRETEETAVWTPEQCGFGTHRSSVFKRSSRYVILDVTFALKKTTESLPVRYAALSERLDVQIGDVVPVPDVRAAVLALRGERGMVLDAGDHDTWSVGSFFLNPVLAEVPEAAAHAPSFPDPAGTKIPAAWLIQNAGFPRGYGTEFGRGTAALSSKHVLAVTNRGGARASDIMALATHVRDGVQEKFGVTLTPECDLVNCALG
ncbi:UDP-N-acetylenolpyruvoylglucosamine reductase [Rhodococcus sp. 15-2388-1-1a]|uniref:UDP-N-acetylmuramate dehydrogenase n=1 Tax=Nocardiaceae TaxID=85025 RepID=UPI00055B9C99|nr:MULTISPECIES: UDP-N-acetylmuramate dehydrogenase [Rhodococcus]OZE91527.1 UDP-N-acetylenolpyruvoylglucosamine reductase [Rhodococcus sp. 15-2388-1-1a]